MDDGKLRRPAPAPTITLFTAHAPRLLGRIGASSWCSRPRSHLTGPWLRGSEPSTRAPGGTGKPSFRFCTATEHSHQLREAGQSGPGLLFHLPHLSHQSTPPPVPSAAPPWAEAFPVGFPSLSWCNLSLGCSPSTCWSQSQLLRAACSSALEPGPHLPRSHVPPSLCLRSKHQSSLKKLLPTSRTQNLFFLEALGLASWIWHLACHLSFFIVVMCFFLRLNS